jgi:F-type H+-transporting ATPase subunit alpha
MNKELDLVRSIEYALKQLPESELHEVGTVVKVVDNVASVYGLSKALYNELVEFESGSTGVILSLDEYFASVVIFQTNASGVTEGDTAKRTNQTLKIGVGQSQVGRIVDATGTPCDALGAIEFEDFVSVEKPAPSIMDRSAINEPLQTGILAIDCLVPIGKGQRELILGDRSTGKTSIIVDTIISQKNKNVLCIYVSIGNKQSSTAKIINTLELYGAMAYTIVVQADAYSSALSQFFAPYTGCAIGEFFMNKGRDVLIAYDDLSNHAVAYRELSLLLRRSPGREAYPGDIFYIHSRLLERACKLSKLKGGGSLTALPVVQTQGDDISAYIPTNLISITDGQIILDSNLFKRGVRPAINIGGSVSRVGGNAQTKAIKKVSASLKLDLAQYEELAAFSQFGSELDKKSKQSLERGARAVELLKQSKQQSYSFVDQTLLLLLLREGLFDIVGIETVQEFAVKYISFIEEAHSHLYKSIEDSKDLDEKVAQELIEIAHEFSLIFSKGQSV